MLFLNRNNNPPRRAERRRERRKRREGGELGSEAENVVPRAEPLGPACLRSRCVSAGRKGPSALPRLTGRPGLAQGRTATNAQPPGYISFLHRMPCAPHILLSDVNTTTFQPQQSQGTDYAQGSSHPSTLSRRLSLPGAGCPPKVSLEMSR